MSAFIDSSLSFGGNHDKQCFFVVRFVPELERVLPTFVLGGS
jgi:hypothetical protein